MYREAHSRIGVHSLSRRIPEEERTTRNRGYCFLASVSRYGEYWSIVFQSHHRLNQCAMCIHVAVIAEDSQETQETEGRYWRGCNSIARACPWTFRGRGRDTEGKLDRISGSARCEKEEEVGSIPCPCISTRLSTGASN